MHSLSNMLLALPMHRKCKLLGMLCSLSVNRVMQRKRFRLVAIQKAPWRLALDCLGLFLLYAYLPLTLLHKIFDAFWNKHL